MKQQGWYCELCLARGVVNYEDGLGAFDVVNRIEDAHRETSPECAVPVRNLRVVNAAVVTETARLN